jgi:tetratricopeptide (TPR) repeat protein
MMRFALPLAAAGFALGAMIASAETPAPPASPPASTPAPKTDAEAAADLFDRLAKTEDPDEAAGIVGALQHLWLRSGSDSADLLMGRALEAMRAQDNPLALKLLDAVVDLDPDWAEAWNKRATMRFEIGDYRGSMADIAETLKRNPRHIGALAGLGEILDDSGLHDQALQAYERALAIAPHYKPLLDRVEQLRALQAGNSL